MRSRALLAVLSISALLAASMPASRRLFADDPAPAPAPEPAPDEDETRGYVGYMPALAQELTEEQRKELHVTKTVGVVVTFLVTGAPGELAGLHVGDLLLKINGTDVPDSSKIGPKDEVAAKEYMEKTLRELTRKVKPGDTVELVVEREAKTLTLKAVALDKAAYNVLREAMAEEDAAVKVPETKGAGAPKAAAIDFETLPAGENVPTDFLQVKGVWSVEVEEAKPANHGIVQEGEWGEGFAFGLLTGDGHVYEDGTSSVRFQLLGGEHSVSAGIVFRAQSWKSYYVARVDGVSKSLRIYLAKDKKLVPLATTDLPSPKRRAWHTLEVTWKGPQLRATFDGTVTVEAKDSTFTTGWVGLAAQGDAKTIFDDWKVAPSSGATK